ncbi:hypothetical protein CLF_101859 [Clonorchis sinensis]|uniref:Uncharacterized protein n=1 Tax=Clonorchis sinensis TaxID=79923 RepID=H2KPF3_CLOSI|nr:hypothetical protein CLF_101859 [Clonorchis sinensis]
MDSSKTIAISVTFQLEETFSAYKLIAANRQCVGKTCQPFRRVYNGNGQNRYCCTSRLCNVDRETDCRLEKNTVIIQVEQTRLKLSDGQVRTETKVFPAKNLCSRTGSAKIISLT